MNRSDRTGGRDNTSLDVFSLVVGLLFTAFAVFALYLAFGGSYDRTVLKVALPAFLVVLGATGLLLSRRT